MDVSAACVWIDWPLKLTRNGNSSYEYDVTWNQKGFDTASKITDFPAILPVTIAP